MQNIRFLSIQNVRALHQRSIETYGGSHGVRDLNLLESALAQPAAQFAGEYLHEGVPAMAAAYLFHLAKNHPFVDGNKRIGVLAALAFLHANGWWVDVEESVFLDFALRVAAGEASKEDAIAFFREHARPGAGGDASAATAP